jgi:hypothetical protein
MAEQLPSSSQLESEPAVTVLHLDLLDDTEIDNVTYLNSDPELNRRTALQSIGRVTMSMAVRDIRPNGSTREITAEYGEILSSEPMRMVEDIKSGVIEVDFLQYWNGYRGDGMGTPHVGYKRPDDRSLETLRILSMRWTPHPASVEGVYIHPRNHKHKLLDYRSKLRRDDGKAEIEALRNDLWGPDENNT